jgi:cytochrome P450
MIRPPDRIDPNSSAFLQSPFQPLARLRAESPIYLVPGGAFYFVSRYDDVQELLRRPEDFSSYFASLFDGMGDVFVPEPVLNFSDPPVHGRTKAIALRAFNPRRVNALEGQITQWVDRLIDGFIDEGEVELLHQFAIPLPMTVIAHLLGVPIDDQERFKYWSDQMIVLFDPAASPGDVQHAREAMKAANAYLLDKIRERRSRPRDDLISTLATARSEDDGGSLLTDGEALGMIQLLLTGGNETTTNAIVNSMLILLDNPAVMDGLREERLSWDHVIEELLRLESPVRGFWRLATRDTELGGVFLPKGALIFYSITSANRDETRFESPERLEPSRYNGKAHMAFGQGIHLCVGAWLARKELKVALKRLLARMHHIRLTPGRNDLNNLFFTNAITRGARGLHLSFDRVR